MPTHTPRGSQGFDKAEGDFCAPPEQPNIKSRVDHAGPLSTKAEAFQVSLFYTALMQQSRLFAQCCGHNIKGVFDDCVQHLVGDGPTDSRRALGAESSEHLLLLFGALPALFPAYAGVLRLRRGR